MRTTNRSARGGLRPPTPLPFGTASVTAGLLAALALLLLPPLARADGAAPMELRRDVLALYKSADGQTEEENPIYVFLELPLTYLGYRVTYWDISKDLPPPGLVRNCRAILTWFYNDELRGASGYRQWLLRQIRRGKKVLIFGCLGAVSEPRRDPTRFDLRETQAIFRALGADYRHNDWRFAPTARLVRFDRELLTFERDPKRDGVKGFYPLVRYSPDIRPLAELRATVNPGRTYLGGFISPRGAFLSEALVYREVVKDSTNYKPQLYLDAVRFFRQTLGGKREPRPDLAVLFGRRIFFARIDGDGLTSQTEINPNYLCGALLRDEILVPTPLPFTASFIQGRVDPNYRGSHRYVELAREILILPNVEPASHGLGHPMDWEKGDLMVPDLPGYTRLDPELEIFGSLRFLNETILRGDKQSNLFLWTGYCNPPAPILRMVRERGVLAINGGTCRVFKDVPSMANFSPPFRHVEGEIQVLRRAANDYEFTNFWRGPFDGYRDVLWTFQYGWSKYPMIPIDLYIHYYSAEKRASLEALKDVVRWIRNQKICPITTGEYVRMALDYLDAAIARRADGGWLVRTGGHLRTVRFDFDDHIVDLARSRGVLGYCRRWGNLYVHLDEGKTHLIYLAPADSAFSFPPFVIESGNVIEHWSHDPSTGEIHFRARGFGSTDIWLAGLNPSRPYRIDSPGFRKSYFAETDSLGRLHVVVPIQGVARLRISPSSRTSLAMNYGRYGILLIVIVLLSLYSVALSRRRVRQLATEEETAEERRRRARDLWVRKRGGRS